MSESSSTAARYACKMSGWSLTNLKLQKILYIARMVFVGRTKDQLLIDEAFKAWDFGPVLPSLYHRVRLSDDGHGSRDSQGRAWCELSAGTGFGGVTAAALHGTREMSVALGSASCQCPDWDQNRLSHRLHQIKNCSLFQLLTLVSPVGLEPTTPRLKVSCSTT
jgi:hypothetical protein